MGIHPSTSLGQAGTWYSHIPMNAGLKYLIGWTAVFLFRLIPFRPPNFEPMLATVMPFSKRFGVAGSFLFGFLGIVLYDAITSGWGSWTWATALCYGLLGVAAHYYFRNRDASVKNFLVFGIPATILYDAVTMFIAPIFNGQPLTSADGQTIYLNSVPRDPKNVNPSLYVYNATPSGQASGYDICAYKLEAVIENPVGDESFCLTNRQ